ncbi:hypothetical protein Hdeb2414_s0015g00450451 [Helianthus debilis subsp. tardiflorus]
MRERGDEREREKCRTMRERSRQRERSDPRTGGRSLGPAVCSFIRQVHRVAEDDDEFWHSDRVPEMGCRRRRCFDNPTYFTVLPADPSR